MQPAVTSDAWHSTSCLAHSRPQQCLFLKYHRYPLTTYTNMYCVIGVPILENVHPIYPNFFLLEALYTQSWTVKNPHHLHRSWRGNHGRFSLWGFYLQPYSLPVFGEVECPTTSWLQRASISCVITKRSKPAMEVDAAISKLCLLGHWQYFILFIWEEHKLICL